MAASTTEHLDGLWFLWFAVDTAQAYRNEAEAGVAIHESGLARDELYITTKYSGLNGLDVETSIQNSLHNVSSFTRRLRSNPYLVY